MYIVQYTRSYLLAKLAALWLSYSRKQKPLQNQLISFTFDSPNLVKMTQIPKDSNKRAQPSSFTDSQQFIWQVLFKCCQAPKSSSNQLKLGILNTFAGWTTPTRTSAHLFFFLSSGEEQMITSTKPAKKIVILHIIIIIDKNLYTYKQAGSEKRGK